MRCVIIAHGSLRDGEIIKSECSTADYIICADGGAEYAFYNGIVPDLLIGDMDSIDSNILDFYIKKGVKIERYAVEKDYTDTEICVERAIQYGATEICIAAGVGGRIDHSLGNIFLLFSIMDKGIKGYIASEQECVYISRSYLELSGNPGDIISLIPLRGSVRGVYTEGLKYTLFNGELPFGRALGVSNEMLSNRCAIRVESGEVLVIKTKNI